MNDFIEAFKEAIEREGEVRMDDDFREYEEWDSMAYLSVIAFMDEKYDQQMEETEFNRLRTVGDLYDFCTRG
jgi:acyl carrier protein